MSPGSKTRQVAAFHDTLTFHYEVEDSSNLLLRLENGALCTVQTNFNIPDPVAKWRFEMFRHPRPAWWAATWSARWTTARSKCCAWTASAAYRRPAGRQRHRRTPDHHRRLRRSVPARRRLLLRIAAAGQALCRRRARRAACPAGDRVRLSLQRRRQLSLPL